MRRSSLHSLLVRGPTELSMYSHVLAIVWHLWVASTCFCLSQCILLLDTRLRTVSLKPAICQSIEPMSSARSEETEQGEEWKVHELTPYFHDSSSLCGLQHPSESERQPPSCPAKHKHSEEFWPIPL